jgi:tRNA A37 threonylcarbamoyladenosine dehydratase
LSGPFSRTESLLGARAMEALAASRVAVVGLGGVGGYVVEALARTGVGALVLIDHDRLSESNLNRQILATCGNLGQYKTEAARARVLTINPRISVQAHTGFFTPASAGEYDLERCDYIADAIDTVTGKIGLVLAAQERGVPIISCMGTGNKLRPDLLEVADLYQTSVCPLARVMRRELRNRGVESLKVVYSREEPLIPRHPSPEKIRDETCKNLPGSTAFVPAAAGLIMAAEIVRDLITVKAAPY